MNSNIFSRLIGGLFLVGIGVLFLLRQIGILPFSIGELIRTFWPVILIVIGLCNLVGTGRHPNNRSISLFGFIMIAVGCYFLGQNLGWYTFSIGDMIKYIIPAGLILAGLYVLLKPRSRERHYDSSMPPIGDDHHHQSHHDDWTDWGWDSKAINKSGFIGEVHMGQDYWELRPMNISHFIGDTVLDLTKAQIPYGETKVNISAFICDVKVFVPNDVEVGVTVSSSAFIGDVKVLDQSQGGFMRSVHSETPYYMEASKKVRIVVSTFIGDVKVSRVG